MRLVVALVLVLVLVAWVPVVATLFVRRCDATLSRCVCHYLTCRPILGRRSYFLNAETIATAGKTALVIIIFLVNAAFLLVFLRAIKVELVRKAKEIGQKAEAAKAKVRERRVSRRRARVRVCTGV